MSATRSVLKEWAWILQKCLYKILIFRHLIILNVLCILIFSRVLAVNTVFDVPCFITNNCSNITGSVTCDMQLGKCSCAEGHVRMQLHHHCLPYVGMGEYCQVNEQCRKRDYNVICSKWSQRCQCTAGYERTEIQDSNSTNLCLKAPVAEVEPYFVHIFSGLDTVHIVLGCLTGGLALLACFAGILQLVRKKWTRPGCSNERDSQFSPDLGFSTTSAPSQSQPYSDAFSVTSPCLGDFVCLDGNSTAPPTPGTLGDEDYVVTPPPTYEEALQSSRRNAGSTTTV